MSIENVEHVIRNRRSIRGLVGPPLTMDEVEALVRIGLTAPAPHHTQPWRFVEVLQQRRTELATTMGTAWRTDLEHDQIPEEKIKRLLERSREQIEGAPTLLLGCLVSEGLNYYVDERRARAEWTLATHSFGASLQNILLVAAARGLGAYSISAPAYAQAEVRTALDLDASWQPQALVALGHPAPDYSPFDRPVPDLATYFIRR